MESLTKKTLKNSRSLTYTYYVSYARSPLPTVLLIHGCPDSANLWSDLVRTYLQPGGYGVVAIDDLGYAESSKPTESASYALNLMAKDLCEILDVESLGRVIALGHDWGSILAQRLYNFYPERIQGLVMLNVAYVPPSGRPLDLDRMLEMMTKVIGYGPVW